MKFKSYSYGAISIIMSCVSMSCEDNSSYIAPQFKDGYFIVNEGPFRTGAGSISFYQRNADSASNDIFKKANNGAEIGNIVQSMTTYNGSAYLVANNSNKIQIVNSSDFVKTGSIDSCVYPRYVLPITTSKLYISEHGKDTASGKSMGAVRVYSVTDKKITKRILLKTKGANQMLLTGAKVYVANDGGNDLNGGLDSVISVLSVTGDSLLKTIPLGRGCYNVKGMVLDANNDLWVLCTGVWGGNLGKLIKIRGEVVERTFDVPQGASSLVTDKSKYNLYFVADNKIYTKDILSFGTNPPSIWMSDSQFTYLYGLGFDEKTEQLLVADALTFTGSGQFHIIGLTDKKIAKTVKVGLAPNGFSF